MARKARVVADGVPHHITQRGNNRQDVFLLSEDRRFYLETLRANCKQHRVAILGLLSLQKPTEIIPRTLLGQRFLASGTLPYRHRLMTNHVHLVAVPDQADSMARTLRRAHSRYAQWFNRRYHRSGHLWQGRYFSCSLGPDHLVTALAYVDLNPVRAGMVGWAEDYPWSSARAHVDGSDTRGVIDLAGWAEVRGITAWRETLRDPLSQQHAQTIRAATQVGAPLGAESFVAALEQQRGRPLKLRTRGRPPSTEMPRKTRSASAA